MQKRPDIKWRSRDEKELERTVRNFNAKITRELKKHPITGDALPEKITKRDIKEKIETRQDFNRELKSIKRFLKPGAEKIISSKLGIETTKWEKQELTIKVAQINRQRTIERKAVEQAEATTRGVHTGLKRGEMGDVRTNELRPKKFNFDKIKPGKEWKMFVESVEKQSNPKYSLKKMERFKENYIQGLKNVYANGQAKDLIKMLEKMDAKTIVDTFYSEEQASIDFIYDPIDGDDKLDMLEELWQNVYDEEYDEEDDRD